MNVTPSLLGLTLSLVLLCLVLGAGAQGEAGQVRRRRCFTCRSRGDRGDCRDPFIPPETEENRRQSEDTAVESAPCSTGWCSKVSTAEV